MEEPTSEEWKAYFKVDAWLDASLVRSVLDTEWHGRYTDADYDVIVTKLSDADWDEDKREFVRYEMEMRWNAREMETRMQ